MLNRITLFAFLLASTSLHAQISEGGLPMAVQSPAKAVLNSKMPQALVLPPIDVQKAREEDSQTPGQNRFAVPVPANISLDNAGSWTDLPDGSRVWQCSITSPGALGLVLLFDAFNLPPGARFYAYTPDRKQVYGAYTAQSCSPSGKFTIGILTGETALLELVEPPAARGQSKIHLFRADYAFNRAAMEDGQVASFNNFGDAVPCNININCQEGANWQTEKKGVARILMVFSDGSGWCTGTLIANTTGSYEPYFLTAHHCQQIGLNPDFNLWRFDFWYETAGCANPGVEPQPKSVLGCQRIAFRAETDFMLLKINPVPLNYDVYFNGWSRSTTPASNTAFIHHPQGDIKKISIDNQATNSHPQTINWGGIFGTSPVNTHWKVIPDAGTFQGGSSGCPLFDPNKRIVGQLHGGNTDTTQCIVANSFFGRFDLSWSTGATAGSRLKEWLDPNNTNATTQNGYFQPVPSGYSLSGNIQTHWGAALPDVKVQLSGTATATAVTDLSGNYSFANVPASGNYSITPAKDTNDLNGITTVDMALISKHILGIEPFNSPWKIIAADVNKNNSVTATDIVENRKLILGLTSSFGLNTSWRFFPATTVFSDVTQPFLNVPIAENILISNLQADQNGLNFKGVKIGDTNNTADPGQ